MLCDLNTVAGLMAEVLLLLFFDALSRLFVYTEIHNLHIVFYFLVLLCYVCCLSNDF